MEQTEGQQEPDLTKVLSPRWDKLRPHAEQERLWNTTARFTVVPSGRRSGKTETAKRKLARCAIQGTSHHRPRFFAAAPTRDQAKRIYWDDMKALIPPFLIRGKPSESNLIIRLLNGSEVHVLGMDKPERIEGSPWDGGILDEYANMHEKVWTAHVQPALADRQGWCWFIGVPEGRNHYYDMYKKALADTTGMWEAFLWKSSDILPASEIALAKRDLDEHMYSQEYEGSFLNFSGQAYYSFDAATHTSHEIQYDPELDLDICFDFNVSPGVAVICQEQYLPIPQVMRDEIGWQRGTAVIDEVYIAKNSNTEMVCQKLLEKYRHHTRKVYLYGDASGGARGSAKVRGSDYDIILQELKPVFQNNLYLKLPRKNPPEKSRVNAVNARLKTADGHVHMMVNHQKAPFLVKDLEGVQLVQGGSGEIDKFYSKNLTHSSDALGYRVYFNFPTYSKGLTRRPIHGI